MQCVTFVIGLSGNGGHGFARKLAENNNLYRWYDHPKNNINYSENFTEMALAQNHFKKKFSTGEIFPHLMDRIEPWIDNLDQYYTVAKENIKSISKEKKLIYVCHTPANKIRKYFPDSEIIFLKKLDREFEKTFQRHIKTHMQFPVQSNLDNISYLKPFLNKQFWRMKSWAGKNINEEKTNIKYQMHLYNLSEDQAVEKERKVQNDLRLDFLKNEHLCDRVV